MFKSAIKILQKNISEKDLFLITNKYNIRYLCGYTGTNGYILLSKKKTFFLTDTRYLSEAKNKFGQYFSIINLDKPLSEKILEITEKNKYTTLIFEEKDLKYAAWLNLKKALKKIKLKSRSDLIENIRICKSNEEIIIISRAQKITEKTFIALKNSLKQGQREKEIAWNLENIAHDFGADGLSFPPIIAIGKNSGTPHHQNSNQKLKKGDLILVDMGIKYRGYCTDMTRMIFTNNPTSRQAQIYNLVLSAQQAAIKTIKAGITGVKADKAAREIITRKGYGDNFLHSLGHGVGLQIQEAPTLSPLSKQKIPANSIVTVEPGIYLENEFGVRIEDMILVLPDGNKNLTTIPKSIESSIHKLV